LPEIQFATVVTFWLVPSEYVPVAISCLPIPIPIVAGFGVIEIDSRIAGVTFSVTLPDTDPEVAVITVDPTANALAERVNGCETHLFTSLTSKWV
jgi:hypothetical protein